MKVSLECMYLRVKLLGHVCVCHQTLMDTVPLFSCVVVPYYTPTPSMKDPFLLFFCITISILVDCQILSQINS